MLGAKHACLKGFFILPLKRDFLIQRGKNNNYPVSEFTMTYDRIKISFLVLEVLILQYMSMGEILSGILGGILLAYPFWIS
jgi:hypothetical protein